MAEYLTVNDRALDSTGSGGIEGLDSEWLEDILL